VSPGIGVSLLGTYQTVPLVVNEARVVAGPRCPSVAGRDDPSSLDHEDHRALRCARPVHDPFGHHEALPRSKLHRTTFQVDEEPPLHHVEELILFVVLVPVIVALDHTQPHDRIIDLAERLVVPAIGARVDQC
jgi:hypothetical protein